MELSRDELNIKIENKAIAIINSFPKDKLNANQAMATLSLAMIFLAKATGMSKKDVTSSFSNHWDMEIKSMQSQPITH